MGAGLHEHQRRLVRGQRDPVGKVQPVGHHLGATAARMVGQHPPVGAMLQQVPLPVRDREPVGGVGEVDGAVAGHRGVVGQVHQGRRPGQLAYRAVGCHPQQPAVRVADDQSLAGGVQLDAERSATGLGQQSGAGAFRRVDRPAPEPAVLVATDHPAGVVDKHVLRTHGSVGKRQQLGVVEPSVRRGPGSGQRRGYGGRLADGTNQPGRPGPRDQHRPILHRRRRPTSMIHTVSVMSGCPAAADTPISPTRSRSRSDPGGWRAVGCSARSEAPAFTPRGMRGTSG